MTNLNTVQVANTNNVIHFSDIFKKAHRASAPKASFPTASVIIEAKKPAVQPLYDQYTIERAKEYFYNRPNRYAANQLRNYAMFVTNINIGRRVSDLVQLKVGHFATVKGSQSYEFKTHLDIIEQKTGKYAHIKINPAVQAALTEFLNTKDSVSEEDYLFVNYKTGEPLKRNAVWKIMNQMKDELDLNYPVGTHTMRKTFATQILLNTPKEMEYIMLVEISKLLGHSKVETTMRYIGFDQQKLDELVDNINL